MRKIKNILYRLLEVLVCIIGAPIFLVAVSTLLVTFPASLMLCGGGWVIYGDIISSFDIYNMIDGKDVSSWYDLGVYIMEFIPGFTLYFILMWLMQINKHIC